MTRKVYQRYVGFFFGDEGYRPQGRLTFASTQVKSVGALTAERAQAWGETTAAEYGWRLMEVRRFDSLSPEQQDYYRRLHGWQATVEEG